MPIILVLLAAAATSPPSTGCLNHLARVRRVEVTQYDRDADRVGEDAFISCTFSLTASEVRADLGDILRAASAPGCKKLASVSYLPLGVRFRSGAQRKLSGPRLCRAAPAIKAFLRRNAAEFTLGKLDLYGWRGAFLLNGSIILNQVAQPKGRNRLSLVYLGPV
jgi:hypothetical protein